MIPQGGPALFPAPQQQRLYTGDDLMLSVGLFNSDGTSPHGKVQATITAPDGSLGKLAQEAVWQDPIIDGDPVDGFRATLRSAVGAGVPPVPTRTFERSPLDDGNQGDGSFDRDGFFVNTLQDITRFEGTYTIHAQAEYQCGDLMGTREVTWSVYVEPGIDPSQTSVEVVDSRSTDDGRQEGIIRVHPRDRYGNPIGPGRGDSFDAAGTTGTDVTGDPTDLRDGSYDVSATWDQDSPGVPGIVITQPDSAPVVLQPDGIGVASCPRWLCWALGLAVILLLIAIIILLL